MVLQTERYNGGYQEQSYSAYEGSNGGYNSYQSVSEHSSPYSSSFQVPTCPLNQGPHHQSGWSSGGDYYGNGGNHHLGGGMVAPVKPTTGGYGSSHYENSNNHGNSFHQSHGNSHGQVHEGSYHQGYGSSHGQDHGGSQHQGYGSSYNHGHDRSQHQSHGSSQGYGYGNPYGLGKTNGIGDVITHQISKMTHGGNKYGNTNPNYGHNPSGFNHGYQKPSWTVKGLDDDDDE